MKKIRTSLALLIVLGFISTLVGGVGYVYGNPDGVTDNFDNENYIASKTNLVVSGGQVRIEEEPVVCNSGGVAQTTGWGANLYQCIGSNKRCFNGTCVTCGGWLYSDNCSGCAGQGVNACWYAGSATDQSCTSVCAERGCAGGQWRDDGSCTVLKYLFGSTCGSYCASAGSYPPYAAVPSIYGGSYCYNTSNYTSYCDASNSWVVRACVCSY